MAYYAHTPMDGPALTRSRALRRASPPAPPRALAGTPTFAPSVSSPSTAPVHKSYPASAFAGDDAYPTPLRRRGLQQPYPLAEAPQTQAPAPTDALIFRIAADAFEACFQRGMDMHSAADARARRPMCPLMVRT